MAYYIGRYKNAQSTDYESKVANSYKKALPITIYKIYLRGTRYIDKNDINKFDFQFP